MIEDDEEDTKSFLRNLELDHPEIYAALEAALNGLKAKNWKHEWQELVDDEIIKEFGEIGIGEFRVPPDSRKRGITSRLYFCRSKYCSENIIVLFGEIKNRRNSKIQIAIGRHEIYLRKYDEIG
jgi:predicted Zn-dependent protease